jgi:mycothiol synthase
MVHSTRREDVTETEISKSATKVTIRPRVPDDDERIVDIGNRIHSDFPPYTVEDFRHRIASQPKEAFQERFVAEHSGTVVGHGGLVEIIGIADKNRYQGFVNVYPARQHEGIGSQMYDYLLQRATEVGAEKLYTQVRENLPEAQQFAQRRGFQPTGRMARLSRLHVPTANLEGYEGAEQRLEEHGLRITTLAELGPDDDDLLHALHIMEFESARDIPSSEDFTEPWPYDAWLKHLFKPGNAPERVWIALDGTRPVGIAILTVRQGNGFNDYTGVDRAYRGRGVARALKLKTIEWSQANGVDYIYTGNDIHNKRMLAINIRLGYQQLPGEVEMAKEL